MMTAEKISGDNNGGGRMLAAGVMEIVVGNNLKIKTGLTEPRCAVTLRRAT